MFSRCLPAAILCGFLSISAAVAGGAAAADQRAAASELRDKLGTARGLWMVLGDADGSLALALANDSELVLFVQAAGPEEAEAVRRAAQGVGLLGKRVFVQHGGYERLHLADDLADAVIAVNAAAQRDAVPRQELLRVLRPEGRAIVGDEQFVKPLPPGTDDWSHPYHGPDNNPQSDDLVARRPYLTHFLAEPWYCPLPQMTVVSGGRMFKTFGDRSSAQPQEELINKLVAMNAYNGTILWKRDLTPGFMIHRNTLVATPDELFLADNVSCKRLDAATGKLLDEIIIPEGLADGPVWKWMALENGILYALVGEKEGPDQPLLGERLRGAGWPWWPINHYRFGFGRTLLAIDPATKAILWRYTQEESIDGRALCLKNGRIYFYTDQNMLTAVDAAQDQRRGRPRQLDTGPRFLAALDAATGELLWRNSDRDLLEAIGPHGPAQHWMLGFASTAYLKCGDDALYFAGPQRPRLVAASTVDGRLLWAHDGGNVQLVLRPEGLYALGEGRTNSADSSLKLHPVSGEILARFSSRDRCTRATGCVDSIFTRGGAGGSTALFDVTQDEPRMDMLTPMRPACQDGVVVAHGHLFWGPWMCRCDMTQLGVISLGPAGAFDYEAQAVEADRLQASSSAVNTAPAIAVEDADWPTYRKDNSRSTFVRRDVAMRVRQAWEFRPPVEAISTAPVTAGGLVFVSGEDGAVRALDASNGKLRWTAYTGGPVKYPPAIAQGRAYVGSGDGWVYCFDAATGELAWRFRAAPVERTIPVYGSLASTWPVGGGVLVNKGVVYAAAGMFSYDGTHVYALDAATGRIRWQNHTSGNPRAEEPEQGVSVQGPMLLHQDAIYLAGGNKPSLASYAIADGKFTPHASQRGKDLFLLGGRVAAAGFPLYWRPEDDHFLSSMEFDTPLGSMAVSTNQVALLVTPTDAQQKPQALWRVEPFQEIAAVAVMNDAVLVAGLDRAGPQSSDRIEAGVVALRLADGQPLWKQPLAAPPVAWGLAVDREGRVIVTLQNGQAAAFAEH